MAGIIPGFGGKVPIYGFLFMIYDLFLGSPCSFRGQNPYRQQNCTILDVRDLCEIQKDFNDMEKQVTYPQIPDKVMKKGLQA